MIHIIKISKKAMRQLERVPRSIANKLELWIQAVEIDGLENVRRIPGYHDEALKGQRFEQRSIRLNKAYRAIYEIKSDGILLFASVEEVTKHEY